MGTVILGEDLSIEKFIEIAVFHSKVELNKIAARWPAEAVV